MNNWKVILATAVIFGAGVITGGMLVGHAEYDHPRGFRRPPAEMHPPATNQVVHSADAAKPPRPPEILSKQYLQRLQDELHLAPEQNDSIQKIINDGQNLMRKVVQDSRLEIREVLTAEQRKQFDELMKRPFRKPLFNTNSVPAWPSGTNAPATNAPAI